MCNFQSEWHIAHYSIFQIISWKFFNVSRGAFSFIKVLLQTLRNLAYLHVVNYKAAAIELENDDCHISLRKLSISGPLRPTFS